MKHLKRDTFRLAGTYLLIIMVMSLGFSVVSYNTSLRELSRRPVGANPSRVVLTPDDNSSNPPMTFEDYLSQRADESKKALLVDLAVFNALALIIGGVLSYLLAEKTLQPIEDNMEAQSQFVSDASHELRTPLTALRATNEVALRNTHLKLKDARQVIADNVDDITRLQELANSMLGLLAEDSSALFQESVPLQQVITDAMNMVVNRALAKDIAVDDETSAIMLRGNHQRLTQLLTILLDNAIKYSHAGTTIHLHSERRGRQAIVTVRDEGIGMDRETIDNIFTRFYRAEKSRTTSGYGLGLSIAKKIVTSHGGKITVNSALGKGTTFTVMLPVV